MLLLKTVGFGVIHIRRGEVRKENGLKHLFIGKDILIIICRMIIREKLSLHIP